MTPEISEFSYGFALTNEIVGWANLKAAPIFPSLIEEGKKGGGYDVKLETPGVPLYLQFKRAHCMTRGTAREIKKHNLSIHPPFFRFHITESGKSDQHSLLLELDDGSCQVFYVAPRFHKFDEINNAWAAKAVANRSIFIRPRAIGKLDRNPHHMAYDDHYAFLCSQPTQIEFVTAAMLAGNLSADVQDETRPLRERLPELNARMDQAWERGRQVLFSTSGGLVPNGALGRLVTPSFPSQMPDKESIPTRSATPLSDPAVQQLRDLADNALRRFDAQLVIVQKGD